MTSIKSLLTRENITFALSLFGFLLYVLAKILIFYESNNKKQRNLFGNGCEKWERLRERLRKKSRFFSCFSSKIVLSLQRENNNIYFRLIGFRFIFV